MIIWLEFRHIKSYSGIEFIPIWEKYNFSAYMWYNWVGKSTILEWLDYFLNDKEWNNLVTKWTWLKTEWNTPYISAIFLIKKEKIENLKSASTKANLKHLSNFFWNINSWSEKWFTKIRSSISDKKNSHYLFFLWEDYDSNIIIPTIKNKIESDELYIKNNIWEIIKSKKILNELRSFYSYVYIKAEDDLESFTKIQNEDMWKIFNKDVQSEIYNLLDEEVTYKINDKLKEFLTLIENNFNNQYKYDTWDTSKKSLTKPDLVQKILEVYFWKRVLNKNFIDTDGSIITKKSRKISELSSGEKRQALMDVLYAYLTIKNEEKDIDGNYLLNSKDLILWIDEPELSLSASLSFNQFEKLKEISINNQVLITTHWHWFLPIVSNWFWHFIKNDEKISINTIDLNNYQKEVKDDKEKGVNSVLEYELKSTNELVQSIYSSILRKNYNWIICEWITDKIYLKCFLWDFIKKNNIIILPVWWKDMVLKIFDYLKLPIKREWLRDIWKVMCLTDTDKEKPKEWYKDNEFDKILTIKRLYNEWLNKTTLIKYSEEVTWVTEIENALNQDVFIETLFSFNKEIKELSLTRDMFDISSANNTWFMTWFNLRPAESLKINQFFNMYDWDMKIKFAEKYVEIMASDDFLYKNDLKCIPDWIDEIKKNFHY